MLQSDWDDMQFDWVQLMAQLKLYNNDILISEWVGPDIKNSNEYVIQVCSKFTLPQFPLIHFVFKPHHLNYYWGILT
jgi:hypothetical protein